MRPHRTWIYEQRIIYGGYYILSISIKEKDLGVKGSADMTVSEQCGIAASKDNQILGLIRRHIAYMEKKLVLP